MELSPEFPPLAHPTVGVAHVVCLLRKHCLIGCAPRVSNYCYTDHIA